MSKKIFSSACPMDCPDTCSLEVEVQDERVAHINGSYLNPVTDGFICSKVRRFTERLYSKERILYPMCRVDEKGSGKFERISWDEALKIIREKFSEIKQKWGGEAILPYSYGGSNGMLGQGTTDTAFFAKLGASRLARTVCAAPTTTVALAMYGRMPGVAFEDYQYAKFILIWGANPKASNIHLVPFFKKAKSSGAKIAVVDPRLNFSKNEIDLHLPVYPGTDVVLALAMINFWNSNGMINYEFIKKYSTGVEILLEKASKHTISKASDITKVDAESIEQLARMYAEINPAVLRVGWGPERNKNGGQAIASILAMPALLGKFGVRGGGYTLSNSGAFRIDTNKLVDSVQWNTRELNMNHLGKILLEENNPPVKGLFVYNCNPVATVPNQNAIIHGLEREELFTVVFEQVMTDTAFFADILLPAVTFLEQKEIKKAYGSYALQYIEPVIKPLGEAKPNEEVFAMLGRAMGWDDKAFYENTEDYLKRAVGSVKGLGDSIDFESFKEKRIAFFNFPGTAPVQFETVFPWTKDEKVHLAPQELGENPYEYLEDTKDFSLKMISPSSEKTINSSLGEFNLPELFVVMNPIDAKTRSLEDGEKVRVFNQYGQVHCKLKLSNLIRSGVVSIPKGAWRKSSGNNQTSTALTPDTISSVGGGACFNDAMVEVEKI
jgi:anaerobic selenocysteine-containing dehydrogenase